MKIVDKILLQIKTCIENNTYIGVETDKVELKNLSSGGEWTELYKSTCAFLNSNGGIVVLGIKENNDKSGYVFTGFRMENEDKLKELPKQFTNDVKEKLNLNEYIRPDLFEVVEFMDSKVCILYIEKLPEDKKYVFYENVAYERRLTGDHKILQGSIDQQRELREELQLARELRPVEGATLENLDVDRLNEYIQRLNQGMRVETLKADIPSAQSFLERKKFVINGQITLLGMIVCGFNPHDLLQGRCQVDCFVRSPVEIAANKKVYKENIIPLLESSIGFVFTNISTGINVKKGGNTTFEYPERLIRETVNNALAHRDYSINKFVNITIDPGNHIEIRNPGRFRREQLLRLDGEIPVRRIIPIPKAQNPRLADVLKTFDRWEGKGWGMSSLTNLALDNEVDLSYYHLYAEQDIGLFIPKGSVLDNETQWWLKSFGGFISRHTNGTELTEEQQTVMAYFFKSERLNRSEKYTVALTPDNNHFVVIAELERWGLIYKHPQSPELYPTYLVNRTLMRFEFVDELRSTFGGTFDLLRTDYKDTLNAIFHLSEFGRGAVEVNAAQVGDYIFFRKHRKVTDVKKYNDYKRKIRNIIEYLTRDGYLLRRQDSRPNYTINSGFQRTPSLYD